jgi:uncharacterized protein YuzE
MSKRIKYTDEPIKLGKRMPDDFLPPPEWFKARRQQGIRVSYDRADDVLRMRLNDNPVARSRKDTPGVIVEYDADGKVVGIELLNASERSGNPRSIEVTVNG